MNFIPPPGVACGYNSAEGCFWVDGPYELYETPRGLRIENGISVALFEGNPFGVIPSTMKIHLLEHEIVIIGIEDGYGRLFSAPAPFPFNSANGQVIIVKMEEVNEELMLKYYKNSVPKDTAMEVWFSSSSQP